MRLKSKKNFINFFFFILNDKKKYMSSVSVSSPESIARRNSTDQKRKNQDLQAQINRQEKQKAAKDNSAATVTDNNTQQNENADQQNKEILKLIIQISIIMIALGVSIRYYYVWRIKDEKDDEEELDNIKDSTEIHRNVMSTFFYFCIIIFLSLFMIYVSIQVTIAADSLKGLDNNVSDIKNDPMDLISKIKFEELLQKSFGIDMNDPNKYINDKFGIDVNNPNEYISKRFGTFSIRNIRNGQGFIKNVVVKRIGKRHIRIQAGNQIEKRYKNVIESMNNKEESRNKSRMGFNLTDFLNLLSSPIDYGNMLQSQQNRLFDSIEPIKRDLIIFVFYCVGPFQREILEQIVEKIVERGRNQQEPDLFTLHENELPNLNEQNKQIQRQLIQQNRIKQKQQKQQQQQQQQQQKGQQLKQYTNNSNDGAQVFIIKR